VSLENDIALKLAARGIRILAPIPGKAAVGVEIPNSHRSLVTIRSVINTSIFRDTKASLPMAMGKTIAGEVFVDDLAKMPHLLVAGSTGSGKSVGINTMIASLLYRMHPSDLKLMIIDPKKIELAQYAKLKQHFLAVSPDVNEDILTTPGTSVLGLKAAELEMERRYDRLSKAGVRNILDYNEKLASGKLKSTPEQEHMKMPFLVVVIDEPDPRSLRRGGRTDRTPCPARACGDPSDCRDAASFGDVITGVISEFPGTHRQVRPRRTHDHPGHERRGATAWQWRHAHLASGSPKPIRLQNAISLRRGRRADGAHREATGLSDAVLAPLGDRKEAKC
jgi:S-DNA-T family DNA segregation ATPase FtsK/SpoIIIE